MLAIAASLARAQTRSGCGYMAAFEGNFLILQSGAPKDPELYVDVGLLNFKTRIL